MEPGKLDILLQRYLNQTITPEEWQELSLYIEDSAHKDIFIEALARAGSAMQPDEYDSNRFDPLLQSILAVDKPAPVVPLRRRLIMRWAVAAAILIVVGLGSYVLFFTAKKPAAIEEITAFANVQPPVSNRAMITLADGTKLYLDAAGNGQLAMEGNTKLLKLDNGQIAYQLSGDGVDQQPVNNTLTNPRGSRVIDMMLADGSHVWLNAGSSITYPVAFTGKERRVQVNGEAYFEVTHNAAKPFYVNKNDVSVQVLGTHFNVKAYDDDETIRVTLLEGAVKVDNKKVNSLLKPGQQAIVSGKIDIDPHADTEAVMAWRNGLFAFQDADIKMVMKELSRWYDVDVVFQENIPQQRFSGKIGRDLSLADVLNGLKLTKVNIKMEGKVIRILP